MAGPQNAVVVLLDSLNRSMLGCYGGTEFATPNLDRLAARSVRFDRHVAGSLPCMPARHDILCGALDFLWKPWGSIEIWEEPLTYHLRDAGVTTMLVSDHPHLFETGGENFHTDFVAWEYLRGHESDPWRTRADPSWVGTPALPAATSEVQHAYDRSRTWFREEADFPGPKTMAAAADWLRQQAPAADEGRFLLFVDEFDPHEPFDTPEPYASMYDSTWGDDPRIIWPPYVVGGVRKGVLTEREAQHLRANYGAKLTMIDAWLGRLLNAIDERGLTDDTAIILCTDHGHYLGEGDVWGKPPIAPGQTLAHIPLLIAWPGVAPTSCAALTTSVDLAATLADLFGIAFEHRTHGHSLVPLLTGEAMAVRAHALLGYWGREVVVTDGHRKYVRGPAGDNGPLSMWSNRWSTMPISALPTLRMPKPDNRAWLDRMPGSDVPVIRQPFAPGDPIPFWAGGVRPDRHALYDLDVDPDEAENRAGTAAEADAVDLLRAALESVDAPKEQLERLGIA